MGAPGNPAALGWSVGPAGPPASSARTWYRMHNLLEGERGGAMEAAEDGKRGGKRDWERSCLG